MLEQVSDDDPLLDPGASIEVASGQSESQEQPGLRHRGQERLSRYGSSAEPPRDDAIQYPADDNHGFFAKGRDFESVYVNHKYTVKERETLATYDSLDYLPSHSTVYKNWIRRQPSRLEWDRWVMMGLIGISVGFMGFVLHQIIDLIATFKWHKATQFIEDGKVLTAWGWVLGYSIVFVTVSAVLVVFFRPSAGGSGIPELIGFLNGTIVRHIFNVKTMIVKFLSCCCAVGSGMPVGPEGPMIHLGSLVGAGLSQFKSDTLRFRLPFFERFRNSEDRRNFVSAGAAAGIASAFGAPVGGLLFSMEEVSSFWNLKLAWQIFFCAMLSTFTTDLFNSAFTGFKYQGDFGMFKPEKYILFQVQKGIAVNLLAFIPAMFLGMIGGILGAMFTFLNLKIARARKRLLSGVSSKWRQQMIRLGEPVIIMIIMATLSVFLPSAFGCSVYTCCYGEKNKILEDCLNSTDSPLHVSTEVEQYTCPAGEIVLNETYTWTNKTYNEVATLLFGTGEDAIHHLFTRNTHYQFGYASMVTVLCCYYLLACWAAGTSMSSGLVVPMLLIGALYGRIVGRAMVDLYGVHTQEGTYWAWMDPGAFALVGAASFFGGVSRLTMSLTVIMMEITNDVQFLLPIMAAIMVAKWSGDFVTHPLYHALLELKCIPFLDTEPIIISEAKKVVNLELFTARDVMTKEVVTIKVRDYISTIAHHLLQTTHGGFPVTKLSTDGQHVAFGFINRLELTVILKNQDMFQTAEALQTNGSVDITHVDYEAMTLDKLSDPLSVEEILQTYCSDPRYQQLMVDIEPYVNQSAVTMPDKFSLHRTYIIFRTLGLRHLTVIDCHNHVVGIITRKDLMGFRMEESLSKVIERSLVDPEDRDVELISNHSY